jgi:hypothetical protein
MRDGQLITPIPLEHQNAAVVVPSTFELENSESRPSSIENSGESPTNPATPANFDVFASIEKLGDLNAKGILTDEEFSEKKKELLARL